jgi:sugar phosphate isomerase/epimerase
MKLSFLFTDVVPDLAELARRMEILSGLGYRGVELTAAHPLPYGVEEIEGLSRRFELPVVALSTGWSYGGEGLCLSTPDDVLRGRSVGRLLHYARSAARLGAMLGVGRIMGRLSDEPDEALALARIEDALRLLACSAEDLGARVVLKPVNHLLAGFVNTVDEVVRLIEWTRSPALGLVLDTMHMNIEESSVAETTRRHGGRAWHFHLCETNGGPLGSGGLDVHKVLSALVQSGYDRFVSVKVYRKATWEDAARGAIEHLRTQGWRFC